MLRLLLLILVAYLVYRGIESLVGQRRGTMGRATIPTPPSRVTVTMHREPRPPENDTEELVACARCGVRVPRSRTVAGEGGGVCASCGKLPR
jgi:hypothetical protein